MANKIILGCGSGLIIIIFLIGLVMHYNSGYEFNIKKNECRNVTILVDTLYFKSGDTKWNNNSVNVNDKVDCFIEEIGDIRCNVSRFVERCEDIEVEKMEIKNIKYAIISLSREICINNSICFNATITSTESRKYIDIVSNIDYYEYGYCSSTDGENIEISIPYGFGEDCRTERFNIEAYDEIINNEIIYRENISFIWLLDNCNRINSLCSKWGKRDSNGVSTCKKESHSYKCGEYKVEATR